LSIQGRIRALQIVVSLAVIAMAAFVFVSLEASNYYLDRAHVARQQLTATFRLAIDANRYSEQIAELLLVGEPERPDFDSARMQLEQSLAALRQTTQGEADLIRNPQERQAEQAEFERLDRMEAQFREIDRAVGRLLVLDRQGRREEAITLFRSEIENRLDAEFAQLISDGLADEQGEVLQLETDLARLTRLVRNTTLAASGVLLAIALISGFLFARSIARPIKALTDGALAIERGDLDHRIAHRGSDEHATLSQRFNAMAEQLGRHRAMIMDAQEGLERQVAERTRELADANQQLVATDQQRVRLLTDVNHELRTPLTALRGEAEIALRGASKPEAEYRRALSSVVARADDLARLVDDLLFLARSEAEDIQFHFQPAKLDELVKQTLEEAEVLGRERRIRFELTGAAEDLGIRADPRRLQQLFLIVFDNAVKYADAGSVVSVALRNDGNSAEISVRDHGKGIAAQDLPHVFERFYRGASAREQWSGGTGLGLPIAHWIVEKHNGTIKLSSTVGVGTEAVMRFPIAG
jgi:two-component system, OmpR family, sensor kinase